MTLTNFLLERIAEDEAVAREVIESDEHVQRLTDYPLDADWSFWADTDGARPSVSVGSARVLAECEAKRRIVKAAADDSDPHDYWHGWNDAHGLALAALALPYADHPDYREEWKP